MIFNKFSQLVSYENVCILVRRFYILTLGLKGLRELSNSTCQENRPYHQFEGLVKRGATPHPLWQFSSFSTLYEQTLPVSRQQCLVARVPAYRRFDCNIFILCHFEELSRSKYKISSLVSIQFLMVRVLIWRIC